MISSWFQSLKRQARHDSELGSKTVRLNLFKGCEAMANYALESGMMLPDAVCADLAMIANGFDSSVASASDLARLHSQLAQLVRPAKPNTLRLLHEENERPAAWRILGPLPSVRRLVSAALVFGAMFMLTSLTDYINSENMQQDIYSSSGMEQLMVMLFLTSAAGLGACFNVLYSTGQSIADGNYDPRDESSSWINIALGVLAGMLLCELPPAELEADAHTLVKPLIALLGGFSASLLHRVLARMVETVGNLFDATGTDRMRLKEQELRLRAITQSRHDGTPMTSELVDALNRVQEAKNRSVEGAAQPSVPSAAERKAPRSFQPRSLTPSETKIEIPECPPPLDGLESSSGGPVRAESDPFRRQATPTSTRNGSP